MIIPVQFDMVQGFHTLLGLMLLHMGQGFLTLVRQIALVQLHLGVGTGVPHQVRLIALVELNGGGAGVPNLGIRSRQHFGMILIDVKLEFFLPNRS